MINPVTITAFGTKDAVFFHRAVNFSLLEVVPRHIKREGNIESVPTLLCY
ncbi:DNA-binding winged-HTH domains [Yersinia intermedia ATCC 29909]|nr:DNA-binding winged-HTH domains [Yersinia intermedia ATCC 29909]